MKSYKTLFLSILSIFVIVAGILSITVALNVTTGDVAYKTFSQISTVLGIITAVSALMIMIQKMSKE